MKHLSVFVAVACCGLAVGCGKRHANDAGAGYAVLPPAKVRVVPVEEKQGLSVEQVVGTVAARTRATIEAKVSGRVAELKAVPGQTVKAGELLARLDAPEIAARYQQAVALKDQADRDLKRAEELLAKNLIAPQEFDAVKARAGVAAASVTEAESMRDYAKVTAPFTGVITRKLADVGDLLAPGKPLLAMEDPSGFRFEADVPEALVARVTMGQRLAIAVESAGKAMEGVVGEISPSGDPASRTFLVKCDLPEIAGLRAGQFGRASIPVGGGKVIRIPGASVVRRGQLEIVFVTTDNRANLRLIKTGKPAGAEVEVVSGLDIGEMIVAEGAAGLVDGQPLEVVR